MKLEQIVIKAPAKVNIGLDVVKKREDGYHEVRMIMQTVNIFDTITLIKKEEDTITMECNHDFLPTDESNLCIKAAKLLQSEFHLRSGVHIILEKRIPIAAGMAGGSTDAAAVFLGMNQLFCLQLKKSELMKLAVPIGADVPYCILQNTALAEGIGEILTPIDSMVDCPLLVAKPPISVSTKYVYENLHLEKNPPHPDIDGLLSAIKTKDLKKIAGAMGNILESVTVKKYPIIEKIKQAMTDEGAVRAMMSGSGPTVFGLFEDEDMAKRAYNRIKEEGLAEQIFLTTFFYDGRQTKNET